LLGEAAIKATAATAAAHGGQTKETGKEISEAFGEGLAQILAATIRAAERLFPTRLHTAELPCAPKAESHHRASGVSDLRDIGAFMAEAIPDGGLRRLGIACSCKKGCASWALTSSLLQRSRGVSHPAQEQCQAGTPRRKK
jgi:hypothetical protein